MLPLYLRGHGVPFATVGLLVGISLLVAFVFNYPAGRLGDAIGRRPLLVGGALLYGVSALALILPLSLPTLFAVRVLQGLGFAAILPNANAMVADLAPEAERGHAYSWISAATLGGLTVGPAIAGLLSLAGLTTVFAFSAASGLVAAILMRFSLPRTSFTAAASAARDAPPSPPFPRRNIAAAACAAGGIAILFGSYETVWPLFMHHIGAADWQVGLSFSLFGLPYVLVTPVAGWAADRYDRRVLALAGYAAACGWAIVYPSLNSIPLIIGLGTFEAIGLAFSTPALNAQAMHDVPEPSRGRVQGVILSFQSGGQAVGALMSGALFAIGVGMPFYIGAGVGLLGLTAAAVLFFG